MLFGSWKNPLPGTTEHTLESCLPTRTPPAPSPGIDVLALVAVRAALAYLATGRNERRGASLLVLIAYCVVVSHEPTT